VLVSLNSLRQTAKAATNETSKKHNIA